MQFRRNNNLCFHAFLTHNSEKIMYVTRGHIINARATKFEYVSISLQMRSCYDCTFYSIFSYYLFLKLIVQVYIY